MCFDWRKQTNNKIKYSLHERGYESVDAKDLVAVEGTLHDDFVYFDDCEMRTREEWPKGLQEFWKTENRMDKEGRVLCDKRDCYAIEPNSVKDGIKIIVTFMTLLKEENLWGAIIHRVER